MRKLILSLFILVSGSMSAQFGQQGLKSVAASLSYGSKIESLGVSLRGQYGFTEYIRGSAEYKYYIDRHNLSAWKINADAHYVVTVSDRAQIYPIGGLNFSRWTYDPSRSNIPGSKTSVSRLGLNVGAGVQLALSEKTFLQVEAKEALIKDYSQIVVSAGFMYQF